MIRLVPFGAPARAELAKLIVELKQRDPLAPVTVIVPNNYVGLSLRRTLAGATPLVNVRFQVLPRVAELLGGASLAEQGRRPLVPWLENEAIRAALRERPGVFAGVADHPSTARRLALAARELREVTSADLDRIGAQGERPADVVRIARRARDLTRDYFDAFDLIESATEALSGGRAVGREAGALVWYLPRIVTPAVAALFSAASLHGGAHAILGVTGDADVDVFTTRMAVLLGAESESQATPLPHAVGVASLPDAEEEVRDAVREACRLAEEEGVPLHRMAILYGQAEQYGQLIHEVLEVAGVPHNGPPIRTLAQSLAGRALLGLYRAAGSGYRRDIVADWITSAPLVWRGKPVPSHRWDEVSREAGVVRGADQWERRLQAWAADQESFAEQQDDGGPYYVRLAERARDLATFVTELVSRVGTHRVATAADHAREALRWFKSEKPDEPPFLPEWAVAFAGDQHATDHEQGAWAEVVALLESIAGMEEHLPPEFAGAVPRDEFATLITETLEKPFGRAAKLGEGIFVGPVAIAAEMEFDATFVVGLTEGSYPSGASEDPLLTEAERAASGGLPSRLERRFDERRLFLAALAGGGRVRLSMPRAALRDQKTTLPSRWLLESASALAGRSIYASELNEMVYNEPERPDWFRVEFSLETALREGHPASLQERDLASLLAARIKPDRHFLSEALPGLGAGIRARRARLRRRKVLGDTVRKLDEWNGLVGADRVPLPSPEKPISPTALETFASCPFRYYLGHVLRIGEVERPEEAETIAARDVGTIVHDSLEAFFLEMKANRVDPSAPWSAVERARLAEIATEQCAIAERRGLTGYDLSWTAQKARILRDLDRFLDNDDEFRAETGYSFEMAELAFGTRPHSSNGLAIAAVQYPIDDSTVVAFRGRIDRVDRRPDGAVMVSDYKTGSTFAYNALKRTDPFEKLAAGKHLQLPVYALALKEQAGGAPITAQYWFVSERAGFERREVLLDAATEDAFREIVRRFVDTIRAGYFPPIPGDEDRDSWKNCQYCPYDAICPASHRLELWNQWKDDPDLVEFVALVDGHVGKEAADGDASS